MIVAIASNDVRAIKTLLSVNLAVLRARSGRKICLIDSDPREGAYAWSCERRSVRQWPTIPGRAPSSRVFDHALQQLGPDYADLLINTGAHDRHETLSALIAARVVVVPITVDHADVDRDYPLIARLNAARMFNPHLKVLFVLVAGDPALTAAPSAAQLAAVRVYVAHVMSATLAETVVHVHGEHDYGRGRCICDAETCDPEAAAEIHSLYREIFVH